MLLRPGEMIWVDVIVPAGSVGWAVDVHAPMVWLGRHLLDALSALMAPGPNLVVHDGAMRSTPWSSLVCFDGVGAGEVLVDGRKLVGISQRRTRDAARLQCCWYSRYDPAELVGLLDPGVRPSPVDLAPVATLPREIAVAAVDALAARLR